MTIKAKACKKCRQVKPLTDFYVSSSMGDWRSNKCKKCTKADVRANYAANIEFYKEYDRGRAMRPHRVAMREAYQQTEIGRAAVRRGKQAYLERNPEKRAAHIAVGNAVPDGRLVKRPCEECGSAEVQAHHDDYSKPLGVRWLCVRHHVDYHRKTG